MFVYAIKAWLPGYLTRLELVELIIMFSQCGGARDERLNSIALVDIELAGRRFLVLRTSKWSDRELGAWVEA